MPPSSKAAATKQQALKDMQKEFGKSGYGEGSKKELSVAKPEDVSRTLDHLAELNDQAESEILADIESEVSISGERKA